MPSPSVIAMKLFDDTHLAATPAPQPRFESPSRDWRGALSHPQFDYERIPAIFGNRGGWGPLLIVPDTNLLIDLVEAYDSVESHFGLAGPLPRQDRDDPLSSLRDLFALWFHRDIRWVVSDLYLDDSRKPLSEERRAQRIRVLDALRTDLRDRGGMERGVLVDDFDEQEAEELERWISEDRQSRAAAGRFADQAEALLPGYDGRLVAEALRRGSHGFLTEDRRVLRQRKLLLGWGLSVLRSGELLAELDQAGELGTGFGGPGYELAPDLLSLARFYEMQPG